MHHRTGPALSRLELETLDVRHDSEPQPADRPTLLALSTTMSFNVPALRDTVSRVRSELDGAVPSLVGGGATQGSPELSLELGVETARSWPDDLVSAARRSTGTA